MTTATRPVGCPLPSITVRLPACPMPTVPRRAGHVPPLPAVGVPAGYRATWQAPAGKAPARRAEQVKRGRAALRTGVHPVGHETGPVVYWVPGPLSKSSHRLPETSPAAQPGAGLRSNLGAGAGRV